MVESFVEQVAWLTPTTLFILLNLVIATILVSTSFHRHPKKPHQDPLNHDESSPFPAQPPPALARTPSFFSRVTSFNLSNYYPSNTERYHHDDEGDQQPHQYQYQHQQQQYQQPTPSPSFFTRVASFKFSGRVDEQPDLKHQRQGYQEPDPEPATQSPLKRENNYNKSNVINRVQQVGPAAAVRRNVPRAPSLLSRVTSFNFSGVGRDLQEEAKVEARERHVSRDEQEKIVGKRVKKENKTKSLPRETTSFKVDEEVDNKADDFINRFKQQLKLQRIESLIRQRSA